MKSFDIIIVGGGPAGLSAALVLGRCRHTVLVCDSGLYRNHVAHVMHSYLSRDGSPPTELRRIGREQLQPSGVSILETEISHAVKRETCFKLTTAQGEIFTARKLLLATGIIDNLPQVMGFDALYGVSAFHRPYCDGWEQRDKRIVAYAREPEITQFAFMLRAYTGDLILCTDGPAELSQANDKCATNIPGFYIAGDATRDMQQVIVVAAEGTKAAFEINTALRDENYA